MGGDNPVDFRLRYKKLGTECIYNTGSGVRGTKGSGTGTKGDWMRGQPQGSRVGTLWYFPIWVRGAKPKEEGVEWVVGSDS